MIDPLEDHGETGCQAWPVGPGTSGGALRFTLDLRTRPSTPEIDRAWEAMTRENPRLFDGLFLSVEKWSPPGAEARPGFAASPGHFVCRVERYRHLAVAPFVPTASSTRLLALTGIVTARDPSGTEHVLMGLRGKETRMYGGLWEFAPAGGVDPPGPGQMFDQALLRRVLARELEEEVGLAAEALGACDPVMVVLNEEARSYDVVMRTKLVIGLEEAQRWATAGSWEYERVEWVPVDEVGAFVEPEGIVPQGREMVGLLARG